MQVQQKLISGLLLVGLAASISVSMAESYGKHHAPENQMENRVETRTQTRTETFTRYGKQTAGNYGHGNYEVIAITPEHQFLPGQEAAVSALGAKVLREITAARAELKGNQPAQAIESLKRAKSLVGVAEQLSPQDQVRDQIWSARKSLEFQSTEQVKMDLVPITASIEEIQAFTPVSQSKTAIRQADQALANGDKTEAGKQLKMAEETLVISEFSLPLSQAGQFISQALTQAEGQKYAQAEQSLQKAEQGVRFVSVIQVRPVALAQHNSQQAAFAYSAHNYDAAKTYLNQSAEQLQTALQTGDAKFQQAGQELLGELQSLQGKVAQGSTEAGEQLAGVTNRLGALAQYDKERALIGFGKTGNPDAKIALLQAQFDVALAKSYQYDSNDKSKADQRLEMTSSALQSASTKAPAMEKGQIGTADQKVNFLKDAQQPTQATRQDYETLQQQLNQIYHQL